MDKGKKPIVYEEDDEEPIQISDTDLVNDETVALCLLGKLFTDRPYNTYGLMETMKKLWCPSKGMICRELGSNLLSFQFHSKRDLERVISMEPWQFNKHILVLKSISDDVQPSLMKFDSTSFWIRIYDIPLRGRDEKVLRQIGSRIGEVEAIDANTITGVSRSVRIKIRLDLNKPLKRGTRIRIGNAEPCWLPITYERLPSFCYWCGHFGHTFKDCESYQESQDNGEDVQELKMPYGDWMKASPMKLTQIVPDRRGLEREVSRRTLFRRQVSGEDELPQFAHQTTNRESGTEKQVSELSSSLERVEVGPRDHKVNSSDKNTCIDIKPVGIHGKENPLNHKPPIPQVEKTQATLHPSINHPPTHNQTKPNTSYTTIPPDFTKIPTDTPSDTKLPTVTKSNQSSTNNLSQANKPVKLSQPSQALKVPCFSTVNPNLPYTPTATLIAMVNDQIRKNPTFTKPNNPTLNTTGPKYPTQVKIEPVSPNPPKKMGLQEGSSKKKGKWKRQSDHGARESGEKLNVGIKRKDDGMDVDYVFLGDVKRTKNTNGDSSMVTAVAGGQPRRSS